MSFEEAEKVFGLFRLYIKRAMEEKVKNFRLWHMASCLVFMSDHFTFEHEMIMVKWNGTDIIIHDNPIRLQIGIYNFNWF